LYAYAHPDFAAEQPTARTCLAIIATNGPMMQGHRGVRVSRARIAAVWFGLAVSTELRARVAARYPETAVFANRAAMLVP
jgi:hypothetical protein